MGNAHSDQDVRENYVLLVDTLANIVRPLQLLPLQQMADANERMQTLGPLLEPTAYQRSGATNLRDQRRVIDAAHALQCVIEDITSTGVDR